MFWKLGLFFQLSSRSLRFPSLLPWEGNISLIDRSMYIFSVCQICPIENRDLLGFQSCAFNKFNLHIWYFHYLWYWFLNWDLFFQLSSRSCRFPSLFSWEGKNHHIYIYIAFYHEIKLTGTILLSIFRHHSKEKCTWHTQPKLFINSFSPIMLKSAKYLLMTCCMKNRISLIPWTRSRYVYV